MSIPVLFEIYKYRMRTNILHIIAALLVVLVLLCMTQQSEGFYYEKPSNKGAKGYGSEYR
jgi:hypothetical protein